MSWQTPDAGPRVEESKAHPDPTLPIADSPQRVQGVRATREATVLQTEDLFLGAFGLTRGGELASIEVRGVNGRRMAVFQIEGPGMADLEREYHRGRSVVDLRLLKSEVARLKNLAFGALREADALSGS
jgi:hypothetical protein